MGPAHGLIGHSLGGAAVSLAMRNGLEAQRAVLLAPPADVVLFSQAFAEHLRIPRRAHDAMRQNLESRLQIRWEELHIPTLARTADGPRPDRPRPSGPDVPYSHGEEIAPAWPGAELFTTSGLGHRACSGIPRSSERTVGSSARGASVIVMDRENIWARGWSHVLSTTQRLAELRAFCERVGAPPPPCILGNRRWPHLDLEARRPGAGLACPDVRVFERTARHAPLPQGAAAA